jgi:hypothetical protein
MEIINCGRNVGLITGFSYYYGPKRNNCLVEEQRTLLSLSNHPKYKYVFGITANKYHYPSGLGLREFGFEPIITFFSSHNYPDETLTLWLKVFNKFSKINRTKIHERLDYDYGNCSISFNNRKRARMKVLIPKRNFAYLKQFENINGTPIWFKVYKKHVTEHPKFYI